MRLSELAGVESDSEVTGFAIDHRKVAKGSVFGAFKGAVFNGEDFIDQAVDRGAAAVVARAEAKVSSVPHFPTPIRGGCSPSSHRASTGRIRRRSSP